MPLECNLYLVAVTKEISYKLEEVFLSLWRRSMRDCLYIVYRKEREKERGETRRKGTPRDEEYGQLDNALVF